VSDQNLCNINSERDNILHQKRKPEGNYISVRIGKHTIDALIDSGAVRSLISEPAAKFLKLEIQPINEQNRKRQVSATGSNLDIIGYVTTELYFKDLKVEYTLGEAKQLSPNFLLGVDFLSETGATLDYGMKPPMFTLFDGLIELSFYARCDETNCVTLAQTICIPAFNEAYLPVNSPSEFDNEDVLLEQPPCACPVTIARALAFCKNNNTVCVEYLITIRVLLRYEKV